MSQPRILVLLVCKMQEVGIGTVNGIHVHTSYIIHSYMEIYRCVGDLTHFITGQKKEVNAKRVHLWLIHVVVILIQST